MPQRGVYANRNAGHKARQARLFAEAGNDAERLAAAYAWFRSSVALLARRRPPLGTSPGVHATQAAALTRQATEYLIHLAGQIDRGEYDAKKPEAAA